MERILARRVIKLMQWLLESLMNEENIRLDYRLNRELKMLAVDYIKGESYKSECISAGIVKLNGLTQGVPESAV